ncbi:adenylate kinase [bacterium]|nr:adenylate kinase [bacterium]MBU1025194.1 adenylate kinase [bacterium]
MDRDKRYIFLGPPGSGKGTQAKIIAEKLGLPHIDMGATIRKAIKDKTATGITAKTFVESGKLVPGDIVIKMAEERLKQDDTDSGYILDGFPRSLQQAEALESYLRSKNSGINVINLQVPVETIVDRLSSRLMCTGCPAVFNTKTMPPKVEGICDKCGSELYVRTDDNPDTIKSRFGTYENETAPLIDFYSERNSLLNINADGGVEEITDSIMNVISE